MRLRVLVLLAAFTLVPLLVVRPADAEARPKGCGVFSAAVKRESGRLITIGHRVGNAVTEARERTDSELAVQFGTLAGKTREEAARVAALRGPTRGLRYRVRKLSRWVGAAADDLQRISLAAAAGDAPAAGAATRRLVDHSRFLRKARRALLGRTAETCA